VLLQYLQARQKHISLFFRKDGHPSLIAHHCVCIEFAVQFLAGRRQREVKRTLVSWIFLLLQQALIQ